MSDENSDEDAFESADEDEEILGQQKQQQRQPPPERENSSVDSTKDASNKKEKSADPAVTTKSTTTKSADPEHDDKPPATSKDEREPTVQITSKNDDRVQDTKDAVRAATADATGTASSADGNGSAKSVDPAGNTGSTRSPVVEHEAEAGAPSWSAWSSWGASLLSTASKSVAQFSTEVTEGLNVLVDASVSSTDDPRESEESNQLARKVKDTPIVDSQPSIDDVPPSEDPDCPTTTTTTITDKADASTTGSDAENSSTFTSLTSGFSSTFGTASLASFSSALSSAAASSTLTSPPATAATAASNTWNSLMGGGLEVLELVGRKTMDVLRESDSGSMIEGTTRVLFDADERKKRKPTLSQLLREGKTRREENEKGRERDEKNRKNSLQYWFDEYQGMAHLEALELLSATCEADLKDRLWNNRQNGSQTSSHLAAIAQLFEEDDVEEEDEEEEEFTDKDSEEPGAPSFTEYKRDKSRQLLASHLNKFHITTASGGNGAAVASTEVAADNFVDALADAWRKVDELRMTGEVKEDDEKGESEEGKSENEEEEKNVDEMEGKNKDEESAMKPEVVTPSSVRLICIRSLALCASRSIQLFHKIGQSTLVPPFKNEDANNSETTATTKKHHSDIDAFVGRSTQLVLLSKLTIGNTDKLATAFGQIISSLEGRHSEIEINQLMTDIFLEASQGTDAIKSAFKLLLPVLQFRFFQESQ